MALMVGNGAQAGALSPFAPTGVIVNGIMDRIGLPGVEFATYANNLMAHAVVTFVAYLLFGGVAAVPQGLEGHRRDPGGEAGAVRAGALADARRSSSRSSLA